MNRYIKINKTIIPTSQPITLTEYASPLPDGYYVCSTHKSNNNQFIARSTSITEAKKIARCFGWWLDGEPVAFVLRSTPDGLFKVFAMRYLDALTLKHLANTDWEQVRRDDKHTDGIIGKGQHEKGNILINL